MQAWLYRQCRPYMVVVGKHFTFLLCDLVGNPHLTAKN